MIDWKSLYRIQTAMRYMDNISSMTTQKAFDMADKDIERLEQLDANENDSQ